MKFRFETLLKLNKELENVQKKEFGRINTHLQNQHDRLKFMNDAKENSKKELNRKIADETDINRRVLYENFFAGIRQENVRQKQIISEIQPKLEDKRKDLVEAMRKRRTMEILKERDLAAYKKLQAKREIEEMDEIASNQWRLNL